MTGKKSEYLNALKTLLDTYRAVGFNKKEIKDFILRELHEDNIVAEPITIHDIEEFYVTDIPCGNKLVKTVRVEKIRSAVKLLKLRLGVSGKLNKEDPDALIILDEINKIFKGVLG